MSRIVAIDLDKPDAQALELLWAELDRLHGPRNADPQLWAVLVAKVAEALGDGRVTEADADQLRRELDRLHPAIVLAENWRQLIPNKAALGAFPRCPYDGALLPSNWLAANPERLRGVVAESSRFTSDWLKVAEGAAKLADEAGIPEDVADRIIADAIRSTRQRTQRVG